jgi:hypothetical protein
LRTSVLGKEVGGSGLRVNVSGAPKFRGVGLEGMVMAGNLVSMKRQLRNLALYRLPVEGSMYLIMDGESNPT